MQDYSHSLKLALRKVTLEHVGTSTFVLKITQIKWCSFPTIHSPVVWFECSVSLPWSKAKCCATALWAVSPRTR